jgi:hypothetical protein
MAGRLPLLYQQGELVGQLLGAPGLALEILDEDLVEVQRAHWFDAALELEEAGRLAAVLDLVPEPWQRLAEFRAWVHALLAAQLEHGSVTARALQVFVEEYTGRFARAVEVPRLLVEAPDGAGSWRTGAPGSPGEVNSRAAFLEFPPRRRAERFPATGGVEPLERFGVQQRGLDPTTAGFLLTGLAGGPEHVPVIASLTTGRALAFLGSIPPGQRLWLRPESEQPGAGVRAELEGVDVSEQLRSVARVVPGTSWTAGDLDAAPVALTLERGANDLWYLPVAHLDAPGLDRVLLALASLDLRQGRFDHTAFDRSLFAQPAAVALVVTWVERQPATVELRLPAGAMLSRPSDLDDALAARASLGDGLERGVDRLAAAGVATRVVLGELRETQGQMDRLAARLPLVQREVGPTGADRLPDAGGVLEVTTFDDSTYH